MRVFHMPVFQASQNVKVPGGGLGIAIGFVALAVFAGVFMIFMLWADRGNLAAKKAAEEARKQEEIRKRQEEIRKRQEENQRLQEEYLRQQELQLQGGGRGTQFPQRKVFLGVQYTYITPELRKAYGLPVAYGVWVGRDSSGRSTQRAVLPNSPAEKAGIQRDDIITTVNSYPITPYGNPLDDILAKFEPGDKVRLGIVRNNISRSIELTLEETQPPSGAQYISDLPFTFRSNGWGPVEKDMSNGQTEAGDGSTITINGKIYKKGVGVNAPSKITLHLGGKCTVFTSDIGVDDEVVSPQASVVFAVWGDGKMLYKSPVMRATDDAITINVNVTGKKEMSLVVTDAGDGPDYDHADWADAQLRCGELP